MKTTVDISDPLFERAKRIAARERTTMRALIEEGLLEAVRKRAGSRAAFRMRDVAFRDGRGLQPEFADGRWDRVLDAVYEGRGA